MYNTTSFTQKAFLNSFYLNYLNPTECEEQCVERPSDSIIDTLNGLEINPYLSSYKGNAHKIMKPVRVVARMVYVLFVSLVIAPIGVVYHGASTCKHFTYSVWKLNDSTYEDDKNMAKRHALSMFNDIWAIFQGAIAASVLYEVPGFMTTTDWRTLLGGVMLISGCFPLLGGLYPQNFIANFAADPDKKIGMLISLKLRNELGLTGPDGGLLPFNEQDNLRFMEMFGSGSFVNQNDSNPSRTIIQLAEMIIFAELELIEEVREANASCANIQFTYPFNGNTIAAKVKDDEMAQNFKMIQRKIDVLRSILKEVCELTVNGGYTARFFKAMAKQQEYNHCLNASLFDRNLYFKIFKGQVSTGIQKEETINEFFKSLNLPAINPLENAYPEKGTLYEKFRHKVCVAKNQTKIVLHDLFFLPKNYTEENLRKQYRNLALHLHPDRNRDNSDEAAELFKAAKRIEDDLMKIVKKSPLSQKPSSSESQSSMSQFAGRVWNWIKLNNPFKGQESSVIIR